VFDCVLGASLRKPTLGEVQLSDPITATYQAEDDAYYLLDRVVRKGSATSIRIVRMARGLQVRVLAEVPHDGDRSEFGLTAGTNGTLVISGSAAHAHGICLLSVGVDGLHLQRIVHGPDALAIPAFEGFDGLLFVRRVSDSPQRIEVAPLPDKDHVVDADVPMARLAECL
jgi:hypothetical protein